MMCVTLVVGAEKNCCLVFCLSEEEAAAWDFTAAASRELGFRRSCCRFLRALGFSDGLLLLRLPKCHDDVILHLLEQSWAPDFGLLHRAMLQHSPRK